jgi:hypothetical protein
MAYTFEITAINKLARAHAGVLDGRLLNGSVTTGSKAELIHDGRHFPVEVKGVVLDSRARRDLLSITVDIRQEAMKFAAVGDTVVGV